MPLPQKGFGCSSVRLVSSWVVLQSHNASSGGAFRAWFIPDCSPVRSRALLGGWGEKRGGFDCFLPSLDQLSDLKQVLSALQAYLLYACLVSENRLMAKQGIEALLSQVMHTEQQ